MISVIVYGRNDEYGYNLHKRASLSLNCVASILSDPNDEIIFVDYNTPNDFPTFPEAIRDTLTEEAQHLLRILRVRPEVHRRYQPFTHLHAIEPIARNIGIRRSDPKNRWILSTNTDMIFVPTEKVSLSTIAGTLSSGFYHTPRYDLPESLWETLDRMDPKAVIGAVKELGETAHLNEMVFGAEHMLYDAPGDFQLIEREELFVIQGFCEAMLLGWHVDANLSKRLYLRHRHVGDLASQIRAYHCEHTRSFSTMHYIWKSNDITRFVDHVTVDTVPEQAESWGCPEDNIEEVTLKSCSSNISLHALQQTIAEEQLAPLEVLYAPETFNLVSYNTKHVLPYLVDVFVNLPRRWSIGWLGGRAETLDLFGAVWEKLGFQGTILIDAEIHPAMTRSSNQAIEIESWSHLVARVDAFVFDFADLECADGITGLEDEAKARASGLLARFFSLISIEQGRYVKGSVRRRVILINAINNDFEYFSQQFLDTVRTPLSSRVRHGFVSPPQANFDWLQQQSVGTAGIRDGSIVHMRRDRPGHVVYGPYAILPPGHYRATVSIQAEVSNGTMRDACPLVVEIVSGDNFIAQRQITWDVLNQGRHILEFEVTSEMAKNGSSFRTELRVWTSGVLSASITAVELETLLHFSAHASAADVKPAADFRL